MQNQLGSIRRNRSWGADGLVSDDVQELKESEVPSGKNIWKHALEMCANSQEDFRRDIRCVLETGEAGLVTKDQPIRFEPSNTAITAYDRRLQAARVALDSGRVVEYASKKDRNKLMEITPAEAVEIVREWNEFQQSM